MDQNIIDRIDAMIDSMPFDQMSPQQHIAAMRMISEEIASDPQNEIAECK